MTSCLSSSINFIRLSISSRMISKYEKKEGRERWWFGYVDRRRNRFQLARSFSGRLLAKISLSSCRSFVLTISRLEWKIYRFVNWVICSEKWLVLNQPEDELALKISSRLHQSYIAVVWSILIKFRNICCLSLVTEIIRYFKNNILVICLFLSY